MSEQVIPSEAVFLKDMQNLQSSSKTYYQEFFTSSSTGSLVLQEGGSFNFRISAPMCSMYGPNSFLRMFVIVNSVADNSIIKGNYSSIFGLVEVYFDNVLVESINDYASLEYILDNISFGPEFLNHNMSIIEGYSSDYFLKRSFCSGGRVVCLKLNALSIFNHSKLIPLYRVNEIRITFTIKSKKEDFIQTETLVNPSFSITQPTLILELHEHSAELISELKKTTSYLPYETYTQITKEISGASSVYDLVSSNTAGLLSVWSYMSDLTNSFLTPNNYKHFNLTEYQYMLNSVDYKKLRCGDDDSYSEAYTMLLRSFNKLASNSVCNLKLENYGYAGEGGETTPTIITHAVDHVVVLTIPNNTFKFKSGQLVALTGFEGAGNNLINNRVGIVSAHTATTITVEVTGVLIASVINIGANTRVRAVTDPNHKLVAPQTFIIGQSVENELVTRKENSNIVDVAVNKGNLVLKMSITDTAPKFLNHILHYKKVIAFLNTNEIRVI